MDLDQLRAGLDRISDGEMQRVDFNLGFYEYLGGLTPIRGARHSGALRHDRRERFRCLEPLSAPDYPLDCENAMRNSI